MSHESSQLDVGQLLAIGAPRTGAWTEIGRAEIVHTMFGKAKVRIVRTHDGSGRAMRFAMLTAALAAVAALGWFAFSPEAPQNAEPAPALSRQLEAAEPDVQIEAVASPEPAVEDKPAVRQEAAGTPEVVTEKSVPRTEREPARNPQASKPKAAPPAEPVAAPAKKEAARTEAEMPGPAGRSLQERAVAAVVATPAAAPQAAKKPDAASLQAAPTGESAAVNVTTPTGAPLPTDAQAHKSTTSP